MSTYYIKTNGVMQGDLVNLLKDIETALGGTNVAESITIATLGPGAFNNLVSSKVSAGTAFSASYSSAKSTYASYPQVWTVADYLNRWRAINSVASAVLSSGSVIASAYSVIVSTYTDTHDWYLLSNIQSRLLSHSI